MAHIPDEVYDEFFRLLVVYNCPYAILLIMDRAHEANMEAKEWLKSIVEKELTDETKKGAQGAGEAVLENPDL
jgi:hypothetical protein